MIELNRVTNETKIELKLRLDGNREIQVDTGIGFFNHMLNTLAFWSGWDLEVKCTGDLDVDYHHTVEDVAILLGKAFLEEYGTNNEIERIASVYVPMDEALSRVVVDLCNRPFCSFKVSLLSDKVGEFDTQLIEHFFRSFAIEARATLHLESLSGTNDHHIIESLFKGLGLVLRQALRPRSGGVSSTKGSL